METVINHKTCMNERFSSSVMPHIFSLNKTWEYLTGILGRDVFISSLEETELVSYQNMHTISKQNMVTGRQTKKFGSEKLVT